MRGFNDLDPTVIAIYYLCAVGFAMFCMHPVIIALSLAGAVTLFLFSRDAHKLGTSLSFLLLFAVLAAINPIWYHNGVTVLFVVNDSPVTLEALIYGICAAAMIVSVLYRFRTFTLIMTADKLMHIFGRLSPKLALILSTALRYIPLMRAQIRKIRAAQKGLGIYRGDNIADTLKGEMRIFSIMATWSLETGIITADSMEARGYGTCRRTSFTVFGFTVTDGIFLVVCLALTAVAAAGAALGELRFDFYPAMSAPPVSPLAVAAYISYGLLSFLPVILDRKEALRWRYLTSRN